MKLNSVGIGDQEQIQSSPLPLSATHGGEASDEISLLEILIVLLERKRLILAITGAFAVIAVIISFVLPARYTASVTLLPPQQSSSLSSMLASQLGGLGSISSLAGSSLGIKNPNDTYVAMLRSGTVESAMVQRFNLMNEYHSRTLTDACMAFGQHTTINGSGKDSLIHISIEDKDPHRAFEMANGYVEEYQRFSRSLAVTEAAQRRLFFEQQLLQAKDNLATAEEALQKTEQATGVIQLDAQARGLIESAAVLRAQISAKEVQIQGISTYATTDNSELFLAKQELNTLEKQLAQLGGSNKPQNDEFILPKGRVPQAGLEYVRSLREVKYQEAIFEIIARQFEAAKLDEAKQGSLIQVVDHATLPDKRSFPQRSLIVVMSTTIGFIFSIMLVIWLAYLARLEESPETHKKIRHVVRLLRSW
ncbi:MAG: Wzz/FepE/Etk N-terminal domain-containing protein [Terracidiphilus sp.]